MCTVAARQSTTLVSRQEGKQEERRGEGREGRERKEKERKKTGVINKAAAQLLHTDKAERLAMRETKVNFDGRLRPPRSYTRVDIGCRQQA